MYMYIYVTQYKYFINDPETRKYAHTCTCTYAQPINTTIQKCAQNNIQNVLNTISKPSKNVLKTISKQPINTTIQKCACFFLDIVFVWIFFFLDIVF